MAQKRMFSMKIIDKGDFLDMPLSTQCLYFHLNMRADDDGFIDNVKQIMKMTGNNDDDLKMLIAKNYLIPFENGLVVVKDWRIHNTLKNDRYEPTLYQKEKQALYVGEDKSYQIQITEPKCFQNVSIDKNSIDKNSIDKDSINNNKGIQTYTEIEEYCKKGNIDIDIQAFIDYYEEREWKRFDKNLKKYVPIKNLKSAIRNWERNEKRYKNENELKNESRKAYIKDVALKEQKQAPKKTQADLNKEILEDYKNGINREEISRYRLSDNKT